MEPLQDCVRRRITDAIYTQDLAADIQRREQAALWGEVAEIAVACGWVTEHIWREVSLELMCGLLAVCFERIVEQMPVAKRIEVIAAIECPTIRGRLIHGLLNEQETGTVGATTSRGAEGR